MIEDALSMYDRGELTRDEVFALFTRHLAPDTVERILEVVQVRQWRAAFEPWLAAARGGQPFVVGGRFERPSPAAVEAANSAS